jgi:hypothetical protein
MSEDLLDAECVINQLSNKNVIVSYAWRNTNPDDNTYSANFDRPSTNGIVTLSIIKRSGYFYVPRSSVAVLSRIYTFDPSSIFTNCAIAKILP